MPLYRVFGLTIDSDWELPSLLPSSGDLVDAVIRIAAATDDEVFEEFETRLDDRRRIVIEHDAIQYAVSNGNRIDVRYPEDADPLRVKGWLLGVGMGALLVQRSKLTLHANAVAMPRGRGVAAFMGESGAGKSTLAFQLMKSGYDLFGDDLLSIDQEAEDFVVDRGIPRIKLWRETLDRFAIESTSLNRVVRDAEKFEMPLLSDHVDPERLPLKRVYILAKGAPERETRIDRVRGAEAGRLVVENAYRWHVASLWHGGDDWAFDRCLDIARSVEVFRVVRPWSLDQLDRPLRAIQRHLTQ